MNLRELEIIFNEERWVLNNQRAVYWPAEKALVIADLHLGKAAHFRKNGIAIPTQVAQSDLLILEHLLQQYQPQKLIIVGDFVHAQSNTETKNFTAFRTRYPLIAFILIRGNHDRLSDHYFHLLGINVIVGQLEMNHILFVHEPPSLGKNEYVISGHIHPGIRLELGKTKATFPCFIVDNRRMILPAFSQFTGLDTRNYFSGNSIFYPFTSKEIFMYA